VSKLLRVKMMLRAAASLVIFCALSYGQPSRQLGVGYADLPLGFERNAGQAGSDVLFLARSGAYAIHLTADGMLFELDGRSPATTVKMALKGSPNIHALPSAEGELPGRVNYLIGNDPAQWHSGVPVFSKVRYRDVYPGVDLIYYGNQRQLEYDFVVAPGAHPQSIRMQFEGVSRLQVTPDGDLVATTLDGSIQLHKPVIYQDAAGARKVVAGSFAVTAGRTVGFRLGTYDHRKPLVIDPVLVFSTFLGGSVADIANAVVTDASGNVYVAGGTQSQDFPVTTGVVQNKPKSASTAGSAFVSKLNPAGTALIYSTYVGGTGGDTAYGLAVDSAGDAYVAGGTASKDFPVTAGAFQTTFPGSRTSFVAKLNPTGSGLAYATYLGGESALSYLCCDAAAAVAIDGTGSAYVAGVTYASGFPVTQGAVQTKVGSDLASSAYVAKLNPSGSALVYATFLGGSGQGQFSFGPAIIDGDAATALAVDAAGNAYVAGYAHSADFPVTAGAFQTTNKAATTASLDSSVPGYNAFVAKINPSGSALVYSTYLGGSGVTIPNGSEGNEIVFGDSANALAVDGSGNVYVAGGASSADFPVTAGAYQTKLKAEQPVTNLTMIGSNAFVAKLNSAGSNLVYATFVGGTGSDHANAMAIDASGNAYIAGATTSLDFPVTSGAFQPVNRAAITNHAGTAFFAQLNASGSSLSYSSFLGGSGTLNPPNQPAGDIAYGLALDAAANVYVAGATSSADFPATQGAFQATNKAAASNGSNAFVAKLNPSASVTGDLPSIRPNLGVVDAASYAPVVVPGELATIFGYSLANTSASAPSVPLTNSLGGTQVTVGGIQAPLLYVSPSQINFQVPWELAGQSQATILVTTAIGNSSAVAVNLGAIAPAVFTANGSGSGQGDVFTLQGQLAVAATPATRGQYVLIYGTGLGAVANQPATGAPVSDASAVTIQTPTVTIGGVQASTNFAGLAPGFVGVYQVNALVPATITPGAAVSLSLSAGGMSSKTVTIAVQ
jgi:uncharacterized protein (TIGR03437 family)